MFSVQILTLISFERVELQFEGGAMTRQKLEVNSFCVLSFCLKGSRLAVHMERICLTK